MKGISDLFSLRGKTAIVTGASRGLGRAIAEGYSAAGANVVLVSRDATMLTEVQHQLDNPDLSVVVAGDVNGTEFLRSVFDTAQTRFGGVDILVNNAGIIRRNPAIEYSDEDWQAVLDTNLSSVFRWSREAGKRMIGHGGKIINIASLLSFTGGMNVVAYSAAKGGVAQITKALANEWAKHGVNVNAIAPGYISTDATEALRKNPEAMSRVSSRIPAGRWGEPKDLIGAAIFLASHASDYVSGHILLVDGGFNSF